MQSPLEHASPGKWWASHVRDRDQAAPRTGVVRDVSMGRISAGLPRRRRNQESTLSAPAPWARSEEHTSELQSLTNLVCRLLLEKKKHTRGRAPSSVHANRPERRGRT